MAPPRTHDRRKDKLELHVFMHGDGGVSDVGVSEKLTQILTTLGVMETHQKEHLMAVSAQIQAFSDRVNTATNEIAADLQALRDKIAAGTALSAEDTALLDAAAARLEAMGQDPENPVPDPNV